MAYPEKPTLDYSYTGFSASQGDNSFPGSQVDNDLLNVKTSVDAIIDFITASFRSDGILKATADATAEDISALVTAAQASADAAAASALAASVSADDSLTNRNAAAASATAAGLSETAAAGYAASAATAATTVKVSASDTTAAVLNSKISASGLLVKSTTNPAGNEVLDISVTKAASADIITGTDDATVVTPVRAKQAAQFYKARGAFWGTIANNVSDANNGIDFNHDCASDDSSPMRLNAAMTKRLDAAWAAGTGNGGLFTGTKANSTWYHCFQIGKPDGTVDCGFDTSVTAANIPSGYTKYRRVGSILTDGSGNILAFKQLAREFIWTAPTLDVNAASQTASNPTLRTLKVPPDLKVKASFNAYLNCASGAARFLVISPDLSTTSAATGAAPLNNGMIGTTGTTVTSGHMFNIWTDTSKQIRTDALTATVTTSISTLGWEDPLGVFN